MVLTHGAAALSQERCDILHVCDLACNASRDLACDVSRACPGSHGGALEVHAAAGGQAGCYPGPAVQAAQEHEQQRPVSEQTWPLHRGAGAAERSVRRLVRVVHL